MARWLIALAVVATLPVACSGGSDSAPDNAADTANHPDTLEILSDGLSSDLPLADESTDESTGGDQFADGDATLDGLNDESPTDIATEVVIDKTPPTVASSDPANESNDAQVPFVVKVTFSEAIRFKETVDNNTFRMYNMFGENIPGTLSYDAPTFTVTFTPDAEVVLLTGSPYSIELANLIQDRAGNRMQATTIRFSTSPGVNLEEFQTLAAKYSPLLYQSVSRTTPQFDYPTSFDFDGDWLAANNNKAIMQAQAIPSYVHYDVVETKSHFFIRYAYFYPRHSETGKDFGNDISGAMVVVQKAPQETPIAVETYYATSSKQDWRSYVTTESNIVQDGRGGDPANGNLNDIDRKYFSVNWVFPQSTLFPGGHYQAYLTTGLHASCAWVQTNKESNSDDRCVLNDGLKPTLSIIRFSYIDGVATEIAKGSNGFPIVTPVSGEIGYGLRSMLKDFWVRRDRVGDLFSSSFAYQPVAGQPGSNLEIPTSFVNSMSEETPGGRAPFAWSWEPTAFDPDFYFQRFPNATPFMDPAYYFSKRHIITSTMGKEGFSTTYCFNPYFMIDQREIDPDCAR
jgi:hypothetical protein